jgi:hypothetical protein
VTVTGLLTSVIALAAVAAWLVAAVSFVRAWVIAERHAPFRAQGPLRFINWIGALSVMPADAKPHLATAFKAFAVFFAAILAAIVTGIVAARS